MKSTHTPVLSYAPRANFVTALLDPLPHALQPFALCALLRRQTRREQRPNAEPQPGAQGRDVAHNYLAEALRQTFFLRGPKGRLCRMEFAQVSYLAADGAFTSVVMADGRRFLLDLCLGAALATFDRDDLLRVHKSYAVPVHAIAELTREEVLVLGGKALPVGRAYRERLMACLGW